MRPLLVSMRRPTGAPPKGAGCGVPFASNASARTRRQVPTMLIMRLPLLFYPIPRFGHGPRTAHRRMVLIPSPIGYKLGGRQVPASPLTSRHSTWGRPSVGRQITTRVAGIISWFSRVLDQWLLRLEPRGFDAVPDHDTEVCTPSRLTCPRAIPAACARANWRELRPPASGLSEGPVGYWPLRRADALPISPAKPRPRRQYRYSTPLWPGRPGRRQTRGH